MRKKFLFRLINLFVTISIVCISFCAFAQSPAKSNAANIIEVIYFHAPNRCPSCVANETQTKQVLEKHFKKEMDSRLVTFVSLDLKDDKNKPLVEKYEIVFPTLLIIQKKGNVENKIDFSAVAYQYAFNEPAKYKRLLCNQINSLLKSK